MKIAVAVVSFLAAVVIAFIISKHEGDNLIIQCLRKESISRYDKDFQEIKGICDQMIESCLDDHSYDYCFNEIRGWTR